MGEWWETGLLNSRVQLQGILVIGVVSGLPALLPEVLGWLHSFIPLPVFYYLVRLNQRQGTAVVLGGMLLAGSLILLLGSIQALLFPLLLAPLGVVLARAAGKKETPLRAGLDGILFMLGLAAALWLIVGITGHVNPYSALVKNLDQGLNAAHQMYKESGELAPETLKEIDTLFQGFKSFLPKILPALLLTTLISTVWLNLAGGNWLLGKTGKSTPWPTYREWRLPDWLVWGVILAAISLLPSSDALQVFGLNLLVVLGLLYFFQGLAVLATLLAKWAVPGPLRGVIYLLFLIQIYGIILVAALGLVDIWANFGTSRNATE